jgi:hypothetical protein
MPLNSRSVPEETQTAAAAAAAAWIDDDDSGLHSLPTTRRGGSSDRRASCSSLCPSIFNWRRSQLAKLGKSASTISTSSTSDLSMLCSCDSAAMLKEDLSILQTDTKEAVAKAWKQAETLNQEITKKRAYIEELLWQINFCNERNTKALKYLECSEHEMDIMQTAYHCEDENIHEYISTRRGPIKILQSSLCASTNLLSCVDKETCTNENDLLYADMRLMMASRDLAIEAMEEVLKESDDNSPTNAS